jgi:hypothetical protein
MSFQAYLDAVRAKTGKAPADFIKLAGQRGLTKHGELVVWMKSELALGHGHATAIISGSYRLVPSTEVRAILLS